MLERCLSWGLALMLAALLVAVSLQYLLGPHPDPVFGLIAARSGLGMFEPDARYAVVGAQLIAAVMLIWPRLRVAGAALALAVAAAAVALHLSPWLGVYLPEPAAASAALAAGRSAADIAAMDLPTDKGAMFLLALALAVLSAAVIFVERAKARSFLAPALDGAPATE